MGLLDQTATMPLMAITITSIEIFSKISSISFHLWNWWLHSSMILISISIHAKKALMILYGFATAIKTLDYSLNMPFFKGHKWIKYSIRCQYSLHASLKGVHMIFSCLQSTTSTQTRWNSQHFLHGTSVNLKFTGVDQSAKYLAFLRWKILKISRIVFDCCRNVKIILIATQKQWGTIQFQPNG